MHIEDEREAVGFELDFRYGNESRYALKGVKGAVKRGRCIVLCGSSGCGKSTILRCVNHLIPQFYEGELKGFCQINGKDIAGCSIGEVGKIAASVFQDPRSQFFTMNSSTEAAFGLENFGVLHEEIMRRVDASFQDFQLEKLKDRDVFELSSGERQLVAILSAWAMDSDVLLLDEPTANLDYEAINQLHKLLLSLKERGKTFLISEHRLYYLNGIADEYWLMEEGQITKQLPAEAMSALSDEERAQMGLRTTDIQHLRLVEKSERPLPKVTNEFTVRNICFSYKKAGSEILNGFSVCVHSGEAVGLIGSNGCGKTTFGKLAAGLLKPLSGEFLYNGEALCQKELLAQSIFIMQEAEFQFFTNSVLNELHYGKKETPELNREIERLLKAFGLWSRRNAHPFSLSGGQMQKLVLLLACLSEKPIAILDEPTAGLDYKSLESCVALIREMQSKKIIFVITHDLELISSICTRCVGMCDGKASEEFDLKDDPNAFLGLRAYMEKNVGLTDRPRAKKPGNECLLDPRTKLLFLAVSMVVAVQTNLFLLIAVFCAVLIAALYEKQYLSSLVCSGLTALVLGLNWISPSIFLSYCANFFPRMILAGLVIATMLHGKEAARTLAAFRQIHMPERLIMIFSVVFRFFPVLSRDLKITGQSMKTRGILQNGLGRMKAIPEYFEIMIVTTMFRVIRIAEALSASAETRGIALKEKRYSYISLRLRLIDFCMTALLIIFLACGLAVK